MNSGDILQDYAKFNNVVEPVLKIRDGLVVFVSFWVLN